jgi:hypothetical protein
MVSRSIKLCKDCNVKITRKNAYIDRGTSLRARCKACDYKYRSARAGRDVYSYMDKLFSKLKYEVVSGTRRTSRSDLTWNITQSHIYNLYHLQKGKCNLSGLTMTWKTGQGKVDTNISIDRIDPSKGYEPDNIQLITYRSNIIKHDMKEDNFMKIINMMCSHRLYKLKNKKR